MLTTSTHIAPSETLLNSLWINFFIESIPSAPSKPV